MEAIEVKLDERGRITLPADVRKLLDWRANDRVEIHLAEPVTDKVIMDSLIIVNLGRRERTSPDEVTELEKAVGRDRE